MDSLSILITGAGGAFGFILRSSNFIELFNTNQINGVEGIIIAFIMSAVIKTVQGSSTVSIITTAAFIAPLLTSFGITTDIGKVPVSYTHLTLPTTPYV